MYSTVHFFAIYTNEFSNNAASSSRIKSFSSCVYLRLIQIFDTLYFAWQVDQCGSSIQGSLPSVTVATFDSALEIEKVLTEMYGNLNETGAFLSVFCFWEPATIGNMGTTQSRQVTRTGLSVHCPRTADLLVEHVFWHFPEYLNCSLSHVRAAACLQLVMSKPENKSTSANSDSNKSGLEHPGASDQISYF